jgi:hypothetical protein
VNIEKISVRTTFTFRLPLKTETAPRELGEHDKFSYVPLLVKVNEEKKRPILVCEDKGFLP